MLLHLRRVSFGRVLQENVVFKSQFLDFRVPLETAGMDLPFSATLILVALCFLSVKILILLVMCQVAPLSTVKSDLVT